MTGFTPELVERVGRVINYHTGALTPVEQKIAAEAALEASGIAELTEALRKAALDLHEQGARFLDGGNPVGCAELAHEAARRAEAVLAKIGGNQ